MTAHFTYGQRPSQVYVNTLSIGTNFQDIHFSLFKTCGMRRGSQEGVDTATEQLERTSLATKKAAAPGTYGMHRDYLKV